MQSSDAIISIPSYNIIFQYIILDKSKSPLMSSSYQTDLNNINAMYSGKLLDVSAGMALQGLNDKLSSVTTSLSQLQDTKQNAMSKQNDVKNMVDTEAKRLADKKEMIDKAMETQKRIIYFNDNSRKRYSAYLNIVVTFAILFFVLFLLRVLQVQVTFLPEALFIVLYIVVISIGVIRIYTIYSEIRKHNLYNFDELNFNSPPAPTTGAPGRTDASGNPFDFSLMGCVGEKCCDDSTTWDNSIGKCVNPAMAPTVPGASTVPGSTGPANASPTPTLSAAEYKESYDELGYNPIDYTNDTDYGGGIEDNEAFTTRTSYQIPPLDSFEYKGYTPYK